MKPREYFEQQLEALQADLIRMASRTEQMIADATRVLVARELALFDKVQMIEEQVDQMDLEIESRCMILLARQQPVAGDLRTIGSALKMIADIERCADYAVDIAKAGVRLAEREPIKPYEDLPRMSRVVQNMLHDMLTSFVQKDTELARQVCRRDEEIDTLYRQVRDEIVSVIAGRDESVTAQGIEIVLCARYLERIADHIVNMGERIVYMATGVLEELDP